MRIERLELAAFGPFTDAVLDLSAGAPGGLHLVLGMNEAGKSSALRGLIGFLYGIPPNSTDTFLHPGPTLRLVAELTLADGRQICLARRKGRGNTLSAPGGVEVEDAVLLRELGGISRTDFVHAFGLGHEDLREGAKVLVGSQGVLSQVLFAAASSLQGFRLAVDGLDRDTDTLFSAQGRTKPLNKAYSEYRELRDEAERLSVLPEAFDRLQARLTAARESREASTGKVTALTAERQARDRMRQALGPVTRRAELLAVLAKLGPVPLLPADFGQRRATVQAGLDQTTYRLDQAERALERLTLAIADIPDPSPWTRAAGRITSLLQGLEHYRKARIDCPLVAAKAAQVRSRAQELLHGLRPDLPLEKAGKLRLTPAQKKTIAGLAQEHGLLHKRLADANREADQLQRRTVELSDELSALSLPPDPSLLSAALEATQQHPDLDALIPRQAHKLESSLAQCKADLGRLASYWSGNAAMAEALPVPSEEALRQASEEWLRTTQDLNLAREAELSLNEKIAANRGDRARLETAGDLPTHDRLLDARSLRNLGWNAIRQRLDRQPDLAAEERFLSRLPATDRLSTAFGLAQDAADAAADDLFTHAESAAQAEVLDRQHEILLREAEAARRKREKADADCTECRSRWKALWASTGIIPGSPREMAPWLRSHDELVANYRSVRTESAELTANCELVAGLVRDLGTALAALGSPLPAETGLAAAAALARKTLKRLDDQAQHYRDVKRDLRQAREQADQKLEEKDGLLAAIEAWAPHWAEALHPLGLDVATSPEKALDIIEDINGLFAALDSLDEHTARVDQMESAMAAYADKARAIAQELLPEQAESPADDLAAECSVRLEAAREQARRRKSLDDQIAVEQSAREEAEAELRRLEKELETLCRLAQCPNADGLDAAEQAASQHRETRSALDHLEEFLLNLSGGQAVDAFVTRVQSCDPEELDTIIARLDLEIPELEAQVRNASEEVGRLDAELKRMDGTSLAAEKASEASQVLAGLQADAERFVVNRLARHILAEEMERYRRAHQGPVLEEAGCVFSRLTGGSFAAVDVDHDEKTAQPLLVAVRPGGSVRGRLRTDVLSDGTKDQLFLSLRLAFIHHHLAQNSPLPLVLDDVFVHFDDDRAAAALAELGRLASRTQVIFFTHHRHLADLASATLPAGTLFIQNL